jgi:acylphosphatase
MARECREYRFVGRVQGVGFRATAQRIAMELGLAGFVRNLEDGSVEAVAEGSPEALDTFVERLQRTFGAKLTDLDSWSRLEESGMSDTDDFLIRY